MSADVCMDPTEARSSLHIGIVAYEALCNFVFVRVPNERGRWVLVAKCVAEVDCPICGAIAGEPCHNRKTGPNRRYWVDTHHGRRMAAGRWKQREKPKLRLRFEDLEAAAHAIADGE